jgi:hypothetical protein
MLFIGQAFKYRKHGWSQPGAPSKTEARGPVPVADFEDGSQDPGKLCGSSVSIDICDSALTQAGFPFCRLEHKNCVSASCYAKAAPPRSTKGLSYGIGFRITRINSCAPDLHYKCPFLNPHSRLDRPAFTNRTLPLSTQRLCEPGLGVGLGTSMANYMYKGGLDTRGNF